MLKNKVFFDIMRIIRSFKFIILEITKNTETLYVETKEEKNKKAQSSQT